MIQRNVNLVWFGCYYSEMTVSTPGVRFTSRSL